MWEGLVEKLPTYPTSERQILLESIAPKNTPEWQGYDEVCRQCGLNTPNPEYPFSLHEAYRRCNASFTSSDFRELARFRPTVIMVKACYSYFPYMKVGDIRALHDARITPEKIHFIGECSNALSHTMAGLSVPHIGIDQIILLQNAETKSMQEYFQYYGTRKDIRSSLAFSTIMEVCASKIPLSFLEKCIEHNSAHISLYSETIRSLYDMGWKSPELWARYTKNPSQRFDHWSSADYLALARIQPSDEVYSKVCLYARESLLRFSAQDCLRLAQSKTVPTLQNLRMYYDFLSAGATHMIPNKDDIIECALSGIPTEAIDRYRQAEKKIDSGYTPDTWSISHIAHLYRASITPEQSLGIWNRFSWEGQWKKFDCKREIRAELLAMPGFVALTDFLMQSPQVLHIGKKSFALKNSDSSIGFIQGILKTVEQDNKGIPDSSTEWQKIIKKYAANINEFIQEGESQEFSQIFFMTAKSDEDSVGAFTEAPLFRETLERRYGVKNMRDYSLGGAYEKKGANRADDFIASIEQYVSDPKNKEKPVLIHIGFHGDGGGNTGLFSREHMHRLASIASRSNVVLDIMSCYGGKKLDVTTQNLANVRLSSGLHAGRTSYGELIEAFRPRRTMSFENLRALNVLYGEKVWLLNRIDFRGQKLLYIGDQSNGTLPSVQYEKRDLVEIMKLQTSSGRKVGQDSILVRLLEEILSNSDGTYEGNFNDHEKVSYSEAILYRQVHHNANLSTANHITKTGESRQI